MGIRPGPETDRWRHPPPWGGERIDRAGGWAPPVTCDRGQRERVAQASLGESTAAEDSLAATSSGSASKTGSAKR